jgi:tetratricopeptide (TPR) repeat protein
VKTGTIQLKKVSVVSIIDAPLDELLDLQMYFDEQTPVGVYVNLVIAYLQSDINRVRSLIQKLEKLEFSEELKTVLVVSQLRLNIRTHVEDEFLLKKCKRYAKRDDWWSGELLMVIANYYFYSKNYLKAKKYYQLAYQSLNKHHCYRKAALAYLNYVASESNINPEKKLMADYQFLYRKAVKVKANRVAGICLYHLSCESQKLGAFISSLKYCEEAEEYLTESMGTLQWYLVRSHKCFLLYKLMRTKEADLIYEELLLCDIPEIKDATKVINLLREESFEMGDKTQISLKLTPSWRLRLKEIKEEEKTPKKKKVNNVLSMPTKLSELEDRLISFLVEKPREKAEIIDHLYGDRIDYENLDQRFRTLLSRLRKKLPKLIIFTTEKKYAIADEIFLKEVKKAQ